MKQEFIDLKQLSMTVTEYEAKFTTSSRFAPGMVATEGKKCDCFELGLTPSI